MPHISFLTPLHCWVRSKQQGKMNLSLLETIPVCCSCCVFFFLQLSFCLHLLSMLAHFSVPGSIFIPENTHFFRARSAHFVNIMIRCFGGSRIF